MKEDQVYKDRRDKINELRAKNEKMTARERANPKLINTSRRRRIAKGSGTDPVEVSRLLKQFYQATKMMKQLSKMKKGLNFGAGNLLAGLGKR